MKLAKIIKTALVLLFLIINNADGASFPNDRLSIPEDLFYYQPAATVYGSESIWINPGGLARTGFGGYQFMADYENGNYGKSWGTAVFRDRIGTAYRHLNNPDTKDIDEWITALGLKFGPTINLGTSYRYFKNGPEELRRQHLWTIGLVSLGRGPFAFGAVFSNLNNAAINGHRTDKEQRYSIGYRPIGQKLTLAADLFLSSGQNLRDGHYIFNAEYIPRPGIYINANMDSDRNYQFGFRVNILKYFSGSRSKFKRGSSNGRTTLFVGATTKRQPSLISQPSRRLSMTVSGHPAENPPHPYFGINEISYLKTIDNFYRAADDNSIEEIILDLNNLTVGFGQAEELRQALKYSRAKGKRIICYLSNPNNIAYYVASAANEILIPPVSQLRLIGLRAELTFWAGSLEKLGVKVEMLQIGDYKTAAESYSRKAASDENKEQINRLLDDLYNQFVTVIAEGRHLTADSVIRIIDNGPFTSDEALSYGLVDGLSYRDNVTDEYLKSSPMPQISFGRYLKETQFNDNWETTPTIAVVVAEGEIQEDGQGSKPLSQSNSVIPSQMARGFSEALVDKSVCGIIFRINSPGGFAIAGDRIWRSVKKASEKRPVAVSMGNLAASGGYYIAMPASRLFANPTTVTGSIGIYGGKVDLSGLYQKIDLGKELFTRGRFAGMLTNTRPFTDDEQSKFKSQIRAFYDHFLEIVAENRKMTVDSVDILSRGRVWTGREAFENGLVDELGGLRQALDYMVKECGCNNYRIKLYPRKRPLFILPGRSILGGLTSIFGSARKSIESFTIPKLPTESDMIFSRMPFDIEIK